MTKNYSNKGVLQVLKPNAKGLKLKAPSPKPLEAKSKPGSKIIKVYDRVLDKPGHYRTFFSDTNESGFPWAQNIG